MSDHSDDVDRSEKQEASEAQLDPVEEKKAEEAPKETKPAAPVVEDIIVSGWMYIDMQGKQQGPFTTREMQGWWGSGFFTPNLKVKRVSEDEFVPITSRKEITEAASNQPPPAKRLKSAEGETPTAKPVPMPMPMPIPMMYGGMPYYSPTAYGAYHGQAAATGPGQQEETKVGGVFNALTGRFVSATEESHWEKRGLPSDREGRMMAHYFDVDSWQDSMRKNKDKPVPKQKLTKKQIEDFKKKKEEKKKKRLLQM